MNHWKEPLNVVAAISSILSLGLALAQLFATTAGTLPAWLTVLGTLVFFRCIPLTTFTSRKIECFLGDLVTFCGTSALMIAILVVAFVKSAAGLMPMSPIFLLASVVGFASAATQGVEELRAIFTKMVWPGRHPPCGSPE